MQVNLTPNEYEMVCRVADYHGSYPAALAHEWIVREAARQYSLLLLQEQAGAGILGTGGAPHPSQESRPDQDQGVATGDHTQTTLYARCEEQP